MKLDLQIDAQLEDLWQKIGLDAQEIEANYSDLNRRIHTFVAAYLREFQTQVEDLTKEAEAAEAAVRLHMQRFCMDDDDGLNPSASLTLRIENAKAKLAQLEEETQEQLDEFRSLWNTLAECFDMLEIEDRGEFADQGTDFSIERIDRMSELITDFQTDISDRKSRFTELCGDLAKLHQLLELPPFQPPQTLGDPTFEQLENHRDELAETSRTNQEKAQILLKAIRWLERVLKTQRLTSEKLKFFGDPQLRKLQDRLTQLEREKEERMSDFIESMKRELLALWAELHIPVPTATEFPFVYNSAQTKRTLVALESEVLRLQNLRDHIAPMLELIARREDIITQYESWHDVAKDPNRLTSRRGKMASLLMEEERIRKRYTVELPKIHAQLIPQLEEYEETFGEPFHWDGVPLLEVVAEMHRKEQATLVQTKARQVRPKAQGSQKGKAVKAPNALLQRAPFQLQEFMF
jgi:protein regulator of cytokinesis 1